MASIDIPLRPRDFSMIQDRVSLHKILKGSTPKGNTTFDLKDKIDQEESMINLKTEARYFSKNRYPMSHLLEAGLLVLKVEGISLFKQTIFNNIYHKSNCFV